MEMEKIVERIAHFRNQKGYTYENMADELQISSTAYRKIEKGETKLTVERLFHISSILEQPISDFIDFEKNIHQQINYGGENYYQETIEHFYQENKEITNELLQAKNQTISFLEKEIEFLKTKLK